ncbi:3'-5' exoribonuclease YhaM family protein [Thermopirellula anaerolimosa]
MSPTQGLRTLGELSLGDEADLFLLLTVKKSMTTRTGQPFWLLTFRDESREIEVAVWADSPFFAMCQKEWKPGDFFKVRATLKDSQWGPTLDVRKIRHVQESDREAGFDPAKFMPPSPVPQEQLFEELRKLVAESMEPSLLRNLTEHILEHERDSLLSLPGSRSHHHMYPGGWLEHTRSVAETCLFLADLYDRQYPDMQPPLDRDLVLAGGILHDIGKVRELACSPLQTCYSADGALLGHMILGRDLVREAAEAVGFSGERLLKLEHIIVSHQEMGENGASKPPMFPEALLVHYADVIDTRFAIMRRVFTEDRGDGPLTSDRNLLRHALFRGTGEPPE